MSEARKIVYDLKKGMAVLKVSKDVVFRRLAKLKISSVKKRFGCRDELKIE